MADGDVFGGSNWFAQQLQAAIQQAMLEFQRQQATGFIQPREAQAGPGRDEAMQAIYAHRYDIGQFYDENWGEGSGTPIQRMENWLSITTEEVGDPITFAADQGWIELPEAAAGGNGDGEAQETVERYRAKKDVELREAGLALEKDRLALSESMGISQQELDQALAEADLLLRKDIYLSADEREQERNNLARKLGTSRLRLDRLIATQQNTLAVERLTFDRYRYDTDAALAVRVQDLNEQIQQGNLAVSQELASLQKLQTMSDVDIADRQMTLNETLGERTMTLSELDSQRGYDMALATLAQADTQFSEALDLDYAKLDLAATEITQKYGLEEKRFGLEEDKHAQLVYQFEQIYGLDVAAAEQAAYEFEQTQGLDVRGQEWKEEFGKGQLGMDYLTLMSTLRGPRDWVQYANTLRAAQQTEFPAWAQQLAQGQGFAPFQGAMTPQQQLMQQAQQMQGGQLTPEQAQAQFGPQIGIPMPQELGGAAQQQAGGIALGQQQQQGVPAWGQPFMQQLVASPQLVRPDQWANMTPEERNMLFSVIEGTGGSVPGWLQMMQKAGPTGGRVQGTSFFGGGW